MNEENRLRKICAARALACSEWKPIIPVADTVADSEDADTSISRAAAPDPEEPLLADPEGIEARLAAAL